jgi:hypothetical protein
MREPVFDLCVAPLPGSAETQNMPATPERTKCTVHNSQDSEPLSIMRA